MSDMTAMMDERYAFALGETEWTAFTLNHKKKMINNAIDGGVGYFGSVIDMIGLGDLEDMNAGNTKSQVGCFVFHVDHGATVMLSGNARHFDNEIARTALKVLKGIETEGIKLQVSDRFGYILAEFSLLDHQSGKRGSST